MALKNGYITIYLCDHEIHAIEFIHGYKNIVLHNYGKVELPNGIVKNGRIVEPNALQEKLQTLLNSTLPNPTSSKDLVFVVPENLTFTHLFNMNGQLQHDQLINLIPDEAEKYIPFSRDDIYWDFAIGKNDPEGTQVQYSAISKSILQEYLDLFSRLGLRTILVTDSHEGYKIMPTITSTEPVGVLELNKTDIKLIFIKDNIVHSISSYDFDYNSFLQEIAEYIDPETHELKDIQIPMLDNIVRQIHQELEAQNIVSDLKSLFIWGPQIKDSYLFKYLEKSVQIPFAVDELWDPINLSHDLNTNKKSIALINDNKIPFGIMTAVSMVFFYDSSTKCTNLLPAGEQKNFVSKSFSQMMSLMGLMIVALNIGLIFVLGYFSLDYTFELQKLDKETRNFEELIYGDRYTELKDNILSFNSEVDKLYTLDTAIVDLPEVYEKLINTNSDGVDLVRLSYNKVDELLVIHGVADTRKTLLAYKEKLDLLDGVGEIDFPISNLDKSKDISFEINIGINPNDEV